MTSSDLSQRQRLFTASIYIFILVLLNGFVTSNWFPAEGGKGLWFFSALGLFFFTYLSSPFFIAPRDALVNSATSALLLATTDLESVILLRVELDFFRWVSFFFAAIAAISALFSILSFGIDAVQKPKIAALSKLTFQVANRIGKGPIMFSPLVLISIFGFYQNVPLQQLWLLFIWSILVFIQPVDLILNAIEAIKRLRSPISSETVVGQIQRIDHPNIIRVKLHSISSWAIDKVHVGHMPDSQQREILPLFTQVQESDIIGTGICHQEIVDGPSNTSPGKIYSSEFTRTPTEILSELAGGIADPALIGFVVENSDLSGIWFEVSSDCQLGEGWLVYIFQDGQLVHYQIIEARTKEESFSQNPRGTHIAYAEQLGVVENDGMYRRYGWLPAMNSPVFLINPNLTTEGLVVQDEELNPTEIILGSIPNSSLFVRANFDDMVAYHTAVLGVTGTGKTEFAFDLIKRSISKGTKVFCVDCTGEYHRRLAELNPMRLGLADEPSEALQNILFKLETSKYGTDEKKLLHTLLKEATPGIEKQVDDFLRDRGLNLGIFEITEIANTKASLRATELYLSAIFSWARNNRIGKRILLVLEEAHTVVPETNMFGFDRAETGAVVGRMAQIALQGRKFGIGILLITQRTALVSKSLLSQCNTVISFALHDERGLDYLGNVFSTNYIKVIPNLKFLQAVGFGKAIKSDRPIMFEVPFEQSKVDASKMVTLLDSEGEVSAIAAGIPPEDPVDPREDFDDLPF